MPEVPDEAARARHEEALARWAVEKKKATRWWRAGSAVKAALRDKRRLKRLPRTLAGIVKRPARVPPKPTLTSGGGAGPVALPTIELPEGPILRPWLKVATILDPFSELAFKYEWTSIPVTQENWRETLEREKPEFFFAESAWRGNRGAWNYQMTAKDAPKPALRELMAYCKAQGIPTVFWNKEDPPNYEQFIETAKLFDHVFTVDSDCIPRYQTDLGHERVALLPFGAQPRIHSPALGGSGRLYDVVFAGSYFTEKHAARRLQTEYVLDPAREFGLHIYSRMLGQDERYQFPEKYAPHIVGSLPYEQMLGAYTAYKVFLNVNSVTESPTMCARRIFELAAAHTPVLSAPSGAIGTFFPDGEVRVTRSAEDTRRELTALLGDEDLRDRIGVRGARIVQGHHTYAHRVNTVLETLGLEPTPLDPPVSAVVPTNRPGQLEHVFAGIARQAYPNLQLVLVLHGLDLDVADVERRAKAAGVPDVVVLAPDKALSLGACLNLGIEAASGAYVAKMDDDNSYGEHYLTDLMAAFRYSDAGVVGKRAHHVHLTESNTLLLRFADDEHRYTESVQGGTMVIDADIARRFRFDDLTRGEDTAFFARCSREGVRVYSADRFNFLSVRGGSGHTWAVTEAELIAKSTVLEQDDPVAYVTV